MLHAQRQIILFENTSTEGEIPPQFTQENEEKFAAMLKGGRFTFTTSTPLNIFIALLIQLIWSHLEDISFLTINSLIAVPIPGLPSTIQQLLIKLIYFDILYTELWLPQCMEKMGLDFDLVEGDGAVNMQFKESGYESRLFIKNAGSTMLYVIVYLIACLALLLLQRASQFLPRLTPFKNKFEKLLMWDHSLSLLLSQFTPLVLCSLINLRDIRFHDSTKVGPVSAYFSIGVLILVCAALIGILVKIYRLSAYQNNEDSVKVFYERYSKLMEGLNQSSRNAILYFWRPLNLIRWLSTLLILLFLKDYPSFQIQILLIQSIIQQCLILQANPYKTQSLNALSCFNEVAVSLYLYLTLLLSDYLETQFTIDDTLISHTRLQLAWCIVTLLISVIIVNLTYTILPIPLNIYRYVRKRVNQVRMKDRVISLRPNYGDVGQSNKEQGEGQGISKRMNISSQSSSHRMKPQEESKFYDRDSLQKTKMIPESVVVDNIHNFESFQGMFEIQS